MPLTSWLVIELVIIEISQTRDTDCKWFSSKFTCNSERIYVNSQYVPVNLHFTKMCESRLQYQQECIPVGCVPPVCWPHPSMHWAGGVYPSMHWAGGLCIPACTGAGGVSALGWCLPGGVWQRPPVNRMADRRKNITFVAGGKNKHWYNNAIILNFVNLLKK